MGDVETGVAQGTETTLLEGWIVAPETPGMYTIAVANPYAAVLTSDSSRSSAAPRVACPRWRRVMVICSCKNMPSS